MVTSTSSESVRARAPFARTALRRRAGRWPSRFTSALILGERGGGSRCATAPRRPPTLSGMFPAWTARASRSFVGSERRWRGSCRARGAFVRRARRRRRLLRHALDARCPARGRLVPRGAGYERVCVCTEGRRPAPNRVARSVRRRRARPVPRAGRARRGERRAIRVRHLPGPRHRVRIRRRPRRPCSRSCSRCATRACPGSCCCSTTSRCNRLWRRGRPRSSRGCTARSATPPSTMCPTEYVGTHPSPYLSELGAGCRRPSTSCGPARRSALRSCAPRRPRGAEPTRWATRRVIVWDNYPVNDALMTASLHLGPYRGREADLAGVVGGILCNPMTQAHRVAGRAGDGDGLPHRPRRLRPGRVVGAGGRRRGWQPRRGPRRASRACADSPVAEPGTLDLSRRIDILEDVLDGPDWIAAVADLATSSGRPDPCPRPSRRVARRPTRSRPKWVRGRPRPAGRPMPVSLPCA